jgi:hypothetical protein
LKGKFCGAFHLSVKLFPVSKNTPAGGKNQASICEISGECCSASAKPPAARF